jgi:hypothetical protein
MKELAAVLVKHYGITEGRYDILVEFQIGVGGVGPTPDSRLPGAMVGISKIGLSPVVPGRAEGPATIDAAEVNRRSVRRTPARKRTS